MLKEEQARQLSARCAAASPAATLVAIAGTESGFHPLAIRVNGRPGATYGPTSKAEAVTLASSLIAAGRSVDLGLAQINSRNLARLHLSVADAFDPCRNLAAAAAILNQGYAAALQRSARGRPLLQTAYSLYNTGDVERGFGNGYAAKVEASAHRGE